MKGIFHENPSVCSELIKGLFMPTQERDQFSDTQHAALRASAYGSQLISNT
jgi:hypothetical protein